MATKNTTKTASNVETAWNKAKNEGKSPFETVIALLAEQEGALNVLNSKVEDLNGLISKSKSNAKTA